MSFYGDLASIGLKDLFQNLEQAQRTGTLTIEGAGEPTLIFIEAGKVSMLAASSRPPLVKALVRHGVITAKQLETARSKRKGSRRSLGETLQVIGALSAERLEKTAAAILTEDICNLLVRIEAGTFRFREGGPPSRVFDPEERRLGLSLAMNPLLLEAARRQDHWDMVRRVIPADSMHFVAVEPVRVPEGVENSEIAEQLLRRLDGTRSVQEIVQTFGIHSFVAHCVLAQLVRERAVKMVDADALSRVAGDLAGKDPARALEMVRRARETEPRNVELLELEARLCEETRDTSGAAAVTKVMAHLRLEAGEKELARGLLERAMILDPADTAVREKALALEIEEGRDEDAMRDGRALAELYRAPGLHARVAEVLQQLLEVDPDSLELRLEWAQARTAAGDPKDAVSELLRAGKALVSQEKYADAGSLFAAVLEIEPGNEHALRFREKLESEAFVLRKERMRQLRRRLRTAVAALLLVTLGFFEMWARVETAEATTEISRERWIETEQYDAAAGRLREVQQRFWFTPARFLELRTQIEAYEARQAEIADPPLDPSD